jgi:hypothetical protein
VPSPPPRSPPGKTRRGEKRQTCEHVLRYKSALFSSLVVKRSIYCISQLAPSIAKMLLRLPRAKTCPTPQCRCRIFCRSGCAARGSESNVLTDFWPGPTGGPTPAGGPPRAEPPAADFGVFPPYLETSAGSWRLVGATLANLHEAWPGLGTIVVCR